MSLATQLEREEDRFALATKSYTKIVTANLRKLSVMAKKVADMIRSTEGKDGRRMHPPSADSLRDLLLKTENNITKLQLRKKTKTSDLD